MNCRFTDKMKCKRPYGGLGLCEFCKVPNSFGVFFSYDTRGKLVGEQRFLLERERANILKNLQAQVERLQKEQELILAIPSRKEYERAK